MADTGPLHQPGTRAALRHGLRGGRRQQVGLGTAQQQRGAGDAVVGLPQHRLAGLGDLWRELAEGHGDAGVAAVIDLIVACSGLSMIEVENLDELVNAAEARLRGEFVDQGIFQRAARSLLDQPGGRAIDTVVLACTHFPLVEAELADAFGPGVRFVHGAKGIARRIAALVTGQDQLRSAPDLALFTGADTDFDALKPALRGFGLERTGVL